MNKELLPPVLDTGIDIDSALDAFYRSKHKEKVNKVFYEDLEIDGPQNEELDPEEPLDFHDLDES